MARQLHHVVGAAALGRVRTELFGEFAGIARPTLAVARTPGAIRTFADHFLPKIFRNVAIAAIAGKFVIAGRGDHLRNMRIDVQTLQFIAMGGERIEEGFLVETLRDFEIVIFAGNGVEVAEHFSHAAEFSAEHTLHVLVAERTGIACGPASHFLTHVEGLLVVAINVHVEQSSHDFVDGIKRRPDPFALAQAIEELNGKCAQITALHSILALSKLGNDGCPIFLDFFVAGAGIHKRRRGKIVPAGVMAAEFAIGSFPTSERLRRRRKPGIDAKCVHQAIRRQRVQKLPIGFHRDFAGPFAQPHVLHGKRTSFPRNLLSVERFAVFLHSF